MSGNERAQPPCDVRAGRLVALARAIAGATLLLGLAALPIQAQAAADSRTTDWLVATAVLAAPAPLRAAAEVRGWKGADLVVLRRGSNGLICLADRPDGAGFAAACYSASLEPFMARGRELRRQGIDGARRDEQRWAEVKSGKLKLPAMGMVYNLRFPEEQFDAATADPGAGSRLHALYIPGATAESTGLPVQPGDGPWLMLAGTPSAHVMISLPRKTPGQ